MTTSDRSAPFLSVVEANKGIIYRVANSYCKNSEDRKDLVQEIVIQLWKSFGGYDHSFKYSTWMYRISLNVAISFYRKEHRRKRISDPLTEGIINLQFEESTEDKESELSALDRMIQQLNDLDKALMILYLEERPHKEIAQIIGISETNVATKIGRIKNVLKEKLTHPNNR